MECDGTTSLWLGVMAAPPARPRTGLGGNPWPADQSARAPSESCVMPQQSMESPARADPPVALFSGANRKARDGDGYRNRDP